MLHCYNTMALGMHQERVTFFIAYAKENSAPVALFEIPRRLSQRRARFVIAMPSPGNEISAVVISDFAGKRILLPAFQGLLARRRIELAIAAHGGVEG